MLDALSAQLEAALLRELQAYYDWENRARFGNRLKRPLLVLSDAASRLGRWIHPTRTIELSRTLLVERSWLEVTSVLEHEMAHQYCDEVLGVVESAHGETFRRVCAERGIDGRAAGAPEASTSGGVPRSEQILDRIRKLLALAGSPNQHEAELAMNKAHELMVRHNIEVTAAGAELGYVVRHLGDPEKRGTRVESDIVGLLVEFFFVKAIRVPVYVAKTGKRGQVYEIVGTEQNVEMACHVHAFLLATAERLWQENRGDTRVRSGRDRLSYQSGVINGFREKLVGERKGLKQREGLVWVGDRKLDTFYRARHPHITTRTTRVRLTGAHQAGREAGRTVVLHKPVSSTSGGTRGLLR
ncbi:MAG TPA: DUF2786 domain-containing protein [Kofleriaceae bacterium]|nr:DUF2786 domain-containing protein [Kofleriaceae bacterium]